MNSKMSFGLAVFAVVPFAWAALTGNPSEEQVDHARQVVETVDAQRIIRADLEPHNWLSHGRTYDEQRYSPLEEINAGNVKSLGLVWSQDIKYDEGVTRGLEATPIVVDGVMYTTGNWGITYAFDAKNGELIWSNDLDVDKSRGRYACCDAVNRGVAVYKGRVYVGTLDGRLVAMDAGTGEVAWDKLTIDLERPYTITGAPRIIEIPNEDGEPRGIVLIGNGGAEYGVRGYLTAYDAETGDEVWRFYAVPGDPSQPQEGAHLEKALETWDPSGEPPYWEIGGGGTMWDSMAYDPDLNLLYVGTGNGSTWNRWIRSPKGGDNLYVSSIVALKPETGEMVWYYQTTPGDTWDFTATQHMILADLEIAGQLRKVIMQAPKNGFFYVLDRTNGEFISAEPFVPVNWASHVDPETGRPVETDDQYREHPKLTLPSALGAHNWQPMAFNPDTGLVYLPAQMVPIPYAQDPNFEYKPGWWNTGVPLSAPIPPNIDPQMLADLGPKITKGFLLAWDPVTQSARWTAEMRGPWNGGVLTTAGNLVFEGTSDAKFKAWDAESGRELWSFDTQNGVIAAPMTYEVDGEQYVTVMAGWGGSLAVSAGGLAPQNHTEYGRILTFKLGGDAQLLKDSASVREIPNPPALAEIYGGLESNPELVMRGSLVYHTYCAMCHGAAAVSGSNIPDLRYMTADTHQKFVGIVVGGLYADRGMASFGDYVPVEDARAIHAYLIEAAKYERASQMQPQWWKSTKTYYYGLIGGVADYFVYQATSLANRFLSLLG